MPTETNIYYVLKHFNIFRPNMQVSADDLKTCDIPWLLKTGTIQATGLRDDNPTPEEYIAEVERLQMVIHAKDDEIATHLAAINVKDVEIARLNEYVSKFVASRNPEVKRLQGEAEATDAATGIADTKPKDGPPPTTLPPSLGIVPEHQTAQSRIQEKMATMRPAPRPTFVVNPPPIKVPDAKADGSAPDPNPMPAIEPIAPVS